MCQHFLKDNFDFGSLCLSGVHVGDHGPDVADDGGKDEHADEEVDGDEEVLEISLWLGSLSDGGEGEGGPVEAVDEDVDWFKLDISKSF